MNPRISNGTDKYSFQYKSRTVLVRFRRGFLSRTNSDVDEWRELFSTTTKMHETNTFGNI